MTHMDLDDAIDYARWWAYPEQDSPKFIPTLEHLVVRQVLAELDRRGAAIERVRGMCDVWAEREPNCAGVRAIRDELAEETP